MSEQSLVLISIIYQLLNNGADLNKLNPSIKGYIEGLTEDFDMESEEDRGHYEAILYFADTYFNQLHERRTLH